LANKEHRLVCTFRLPKGKRPSRTREDIKVNMISYLRTFILNVVFSKAISIAGHFYSCHDSCHEKLFIARCEALVSRTTTGTSSSQTTLINNTMIKLTLNDDMTVGMVSSKYVILTDNIQDKRFSRTFFLV
jgi:hypothetical protein